MVNSYLAVFSSADGRAPSRTEQSVLVQYFTDKFGKSVKLSPRTGRIVELETEASISDDVVKINDYEWQIQLIPQ